MISEAQLVRDLKRRENGVLETLYDTYAPSLFSTSLRYCGNREDAEDVLHEGFIKIIQHIHRFRARHPGSLEGWMRRIIVNTALNFLRDHAPGKRFQEIESVEWKIPMEQDEPDWYADLHDRLGQERLIQMICELPPGYRTVFNLYVFEEYSHKQIAKRLHISENTSKSQLSKARSRLRKKISEILEKKVVR